MNQARTIRSEAAMNEASFICAPSVGQTRARTLPSACVGSTFHVPARGRMVESAHTSRVAQTLQAIRSAAAFIGL